jgi:hypothetical protein
MPTLTDRIAKLERDRPAVSHAELTAAMTALEERVLAKLRGDKELPPEPPEWLLAELGRRVTPDDIEHANIKLLRMLERKAAALQHGTENAVSSSAPAGGSP